MAKPGYTPLPRHLAQPSPPRKDKAMTDEIRGSGAALTETEELRARIEQLEADKREALQPRPVSVRMVPLWPGSGVFVPYHGESLGEQLVRREFADIGREEWLRDEAVQAIGREIVADVALREPLPEPSPVTHLQHSEIDTRTGEPAAGPIADVATHRIVDRIAAGFEKLERAELEARHRAAFGSDDPDDTAA